jgi:hypothetical protein
MRLRLNIALAVCVIFSSVPVRAGYSSTVVAFISNNKIFTCCSFMAFLFTGYLIKKYTFSNRVGENAGGNDFELNFDMPKSQNKNNNETDQNIKQEKKNYCNDVQGITEEKFGDWLSHSFLNVKPENVEQQWIVISLIKSLHGQSFSEAIRMFSEALKNNKKIVGHIDDAYDNMCPILDKPSSGKLFSLSASSDLSGSNINENTLHIKRFIRRLQSEALISIKDEKIKKSDVLATDSKVCMFLWEKPIVEALVDCMKGWENSNQGANQSLMEAFINTNHRKSEKCEENNIYSNSYGLHNRRILCRMHRFICEKQKLEFNEQGYKDILNNRHDATLIKTWIEHMDVDINSKLITEN